MAEGLIAIVLFVVIFIAIKFLDGLIGFVWKNTVKVLGVLAGIGGAAALITTVVAVTIFIILA